MQVPRIWSKKTERNKFVKIPSSQMRRRKKPWKKNSFELQLFNAVTGRDFLWNSPFQLLIRLLWEWLCFPVFHRVHGQPSERVAVALGGIIMREWCQSRRCGVRRGKPAKMPATGWTHSSGRDPNGPQTGEPRLIWTPGTWSWGTDRVSIDRGPLPGASPHGYGSAVGRSIPTSPSTVDTSIVP